MVYHSRRSRQDDDSDDETVYSDASSFESRFDAPTRGPRQEPALLTHRPVFYLDKEDGQEAVYEAYNLRYDELDGFVQRWATSSEQCDLAQMHLSALEEFQKKRRSRWASRVLGRRKLYEEQIDEQCKKLPRAIQEEIHNLLQDRGRCSSTKYRTRVWTVAVVRVQENYRFAKTEPTEAIRHRLRFWKNPGPADTLTYYVVIRGCETEVCNSPRGFSQFAHFTNPWQQLDVEEASRMARERDLMLLEKIAANRRKRSLEREPNRRRHRSPPSYRHYRNRSPMSEPETEVEARKYIRTTRAAVRSAPPPAPMAPPPPQEPAFDRYAPPRFARSPSPYADRSYSRPRVPYVEEDEWTPSAQYDQSGYSRPSVSVYAPQHFGFPAFDNDNDSENGGLRDSDRVRETPECIACQVTPQCEHYSRSRVCDRPINWRDDRATHSPCFICMAAGVTPDPFYLFPPPSPPPPCMMPILTQPSFFASTAPPPYPPTERPASIVNEQNIGGEANDTTDIESDGGDLDDGETTAVAESPQRATKDE